MAVEVLEDLNWILMASKGGSLEILKCIAGALIQVLEMHKGLHGFLKGI